MSHISRAAVVAVAACLLVLLNTSVAASPPSDPTVVTFPNPGPDTLANLAAEGWDIWEVRDDRILAGVMPGQLTMLQRWGIEAQQIRAPMQFLPSFDACYPTYDQALAQMQTWAAAYPDLVELVDIGPGWRAAEGLSGRQLWALRITNQQNIEPKPNILIVALHHAREIITPEITLRLADLLLSEYGHDADLTAIVDNREIWLVPMVNPDGYAHAEAAVDWRKNADDGESVCTGGNPPNSYGVDLNRNYDLEWSTIGSSGNPCYLTYHGSSGFSEPETQAVRDLVSGQQFDLVISLHSFGDLVLYPWGYTYSSAPDDADLRATASVLAGFNGYMPQQSSDLYPTSGDTCDWTYGVMGIPCFTFEIGSAQDGYFWPNCDQGDRQWLENRDALLYAIKMVPDVYTMAHAPVVDDISLYYSGALLQVRAVLDRRLTSPEPPAGEVFIDGLGYPGSGEPLVPVDGKLDSATELMEATVDLTGQTGQRRLYIVGMVSPYQHGPYTAMYVELCPDLTGDGVVNTADAQQFTGLWRLAPDDASPLVKLDFNSDGEIDVQDGSFIMARMGMQCPMP
jgi:carboxypeptidase T